MQSIYLSIYLVSIPSHIYAYKLITHVSLLLLLQQAKSASLKPRAVAKAERPKPKSARAHAADEAAASSEAGEGWVDASGEGGGEGWVQASSARRREGAVVEVAEGSVPLSRVVWTMVCLARHSPFLSGEQRRVIHEVCICIYIVCR